MHNINDQNSHITQTAAPAPQIAETFMARSINDQQSWHLHLHRIEILDFLNFRFDFISREKSGSDLLCDSSSFAFLNVRVSDSVQ